MKLSIRSKLLIAFALLLVLSSLIQGVTFLFTRNYISSQIIEFQKVQAVKGAGEIETFFTNLSNDAFSIARIYQQNPADIVPAANYVVNSNTYVRKITILSPAGRELAKFENLGQVPEEELTYEVFTDPFNSAISGNTAISKMYYIDENLGPHIDLFSPIFVDNNTVIGVVKMQINLTLLRETLADIRLGESGYVYVVDNEGRLITHPSEQYVLERPTLASRPVIANALNNLETPQKDMTYTNEKNEEVIAQAVRIPGYHWIIVFEQPVTEAFGFLNFILNLFVVTVVGSSLFLILIALMLSENLTRPIRKLQFTAQQIEKGQLEKAVIINSGDEIESLSHSFSSLIEQLFEREHSLEDYTSQLQKANAQLKEADELKDEFVYVASHELRTPMTAIKNYLWLALNRYGKDLDPKMKQSLVRAYISTERLIVLVQDMLTVSRIEGKRLVLNFEEIDLMELYQQIYDEINVTAQKEEIVMTLVPADKKYIVYGDRTRIGEVIQNLLSNAIKFTPKGGHVTISVRQSGSMIATDISDTGFGIPREDLPRLFKKFGRLGHSYKKVAESAGTGLGLFISKQIIEAHHGSISVESEVDKGSTFTFTLPLKEND